MTWIEASEGEAKVSNWFIHERAQLLDSVVDTHHSMAVGMHMQMRRKSLMHSDDHTVFLQQG